MDLMPEQQAKLAVDGSVLTNDAVYVEASTDPRDLGVHDWQRAQWLHIQGDEIELLRHVADVHRRAYLMGAEQAEAERDRLRAAVDRVEALCGAWDRLSKGVSGTTAAIRAALALEGGTDA